MCLDNRDKIAHMRSIMLIAHLSDPHLAPLPDPTLLQLANKRITGYINWRRNRSKKHSEDVLTPLLASLRTHQVDHIAVTGDLINLALPAEFNRAKAWLELLGPPDRISLVPGNHDAYVPGAFHQACTHWGPYMAPDQQNKASFPYVRQRDGVALIGLSSAVATWPFRATGKIGTAQLTALDNTLAKLRQTDQKIVLLVHHPVHDRAAANYKRLTDAPALRALIARHGVDLILHGHTHINSETTIPGPNGDVPCWGVSAASNGLGGHRPPGSYTLFQIDHGKPIKAQRHHYIGAGTVEAGDWRTL